jgi:hypothetical protein
MENYAVSRYTSASLLPGPCHPNFDQSSSSCCTFSETRCAHLPLQMQLRFPLWHFCNSAASLTSIKTHTVLASAKQGLLVDLLPLRGVHFHASSKRTVFLRAFASTVRSSHPVPYQRSSISRHYPALVPLNLGRLNETMPTSSVNVFLFDVG